MTEPIELPIEDSIDLHTFQPGEIADLVEQAQHHYDRAQQALKDGDWAGYGEELDALQAVLEKLAELTSE